jgi:gliding motility-associated-like protein
MSSQLGRFEVSYARGCAPFTVHINETDSFGDISRQYIYEGGNESLDTFYTYTTPGTYEIVQLASLNANKTDTLVIEVLDAPLPRFDFTFCDPQSIYFQISDTVYDAYALNRPHDSILIQPPDDPKELILQQPLNDLTFKGFYREAAPNCPSQNLNIEPLPLTNEIAVLSADFNYLCDNELGLDLVVASDSNRYYEIEYRTDQSSALKVFEGSLVRDSLFVTGIPVGATTSETCFRINEVARCSGTKSLGDWQCFPFNANTSAIDFAYATYLSNGDIELNMGENENGMVSITKFIDGVPFNRFDSVSNSLLDRETSRIRTYDYVIEFDPFCPAPNQEINVSPPRLFAYPQEANMYQIQWQPARYKLNQNIHYQLFWRGTYDSLIMDPPASFEIQLPSGLGDVQFLSIIGITDENDTLLHSNLQKLEYEYVVYLPLAFTPNGDGLNDLLEVKGLPTDRFEMYIYNRWGEIIFTSNEVGNWWNGRSYQQRSPEGNYTYKIDFYAENGELYSQQGSFVLIR